MRALSYPCAQSAQMEPDAENIGTGDDGNSGLVQHADELA